MIVSVGPAADDRRSVVFFAMHQIARRSKPFEVTYKIAIFRHFSVMLGLKLGTVFLC